MFKSMKIYEKIILILFLLSLCFKIFNVPEAIILYSLSSILIIFSYFFGGFFMFNFDEPKKYFLPIFSGVAFTLSFIALRWCFSLSIDKTTYFFLIPNEVLFISLAIYLFLKRKTEIKFLSIKGLFNRSLVLLLLTSFFAYIPITFRPYRKILYVLNNDNLNRQRNLLMFDYRQLYDEAKEAGNCDKEI